MVGIIKTDQLAAGLFVGAVVLSGLLTVALIVGLPVYAQRQAKRFEPVAKTILAEIGEPDLLVLRTIDDAYGPIAIIQLAVALGLMPDEIRQKVNHLTDKGLVQVEDQAWIQLTKFGAKVVRYA